MNLSPDRQQEFLDAHPIPPPEVLGGAARPMDYMEEAAKTVQQMSASSNVGLNGPDRLKMIAELATSMATSATQRATTRAGKNGFVPNVVVP